MKKSRKSPQREAIFKIIQEAKNHLTVDEIYKRVHRQIPRISLATVYRNLEWLKSNQVISGAQAFGSTYFEPYQEPHHHFICTKCHSIKNVSAPTVNICTGCINQQAPFKVHKIITSLFGLCEDCFQR